MEDKEYGSIVITCKEGEKILIGDSLVTIVKLGGAKVGRAVKVHVKADKKIPILRIRKEKNDV